MRPGMMGKMSPTMMMGRAQQPVGRAGPQRIPQMGSGPKLGQRPGPMQGGGGPLSVVGRGAPPKFAPRMPNPNIRQANGMTRGAPGMTRGPLSMMRR